ncbi:MAG: PqqD family protein [Actinomycetota bacterium]|nr:PqqD family protein [Actinomycetota bacterium]
MNVDDRLYPAPEWESIDLGPETLVYDGIVLQLLTGSAAGIWRLADGRHSAAQIAGAAAESVADAPDAVHRDVMNFLDQLAEQGLLVRSDPDSAAGLRRAPYVGYVLDGSQALLVDLRDSTRHALNPTGSIVWRLICQHGDAATVVRLVRAEFPDAPVTLEAEVAALLEQLSSTQLLVNV